MLYGKRKEQGRRIKELEGDVAELRIAIKASGRPVALYDEPNVKPMLRCTFCGKYHRHVQMLVAGPYVYICNECVDLCNEIIEEERVKRAAKPDGDD